MITTNTVVIAYRVMLHAPAYPVQAMHGPLHAAAAANVTPVVSSSSHTIQVTDVNKLQSLYIFHLHLSAYA